MAFIALVSLIGCGGSSSKHQASANTTAGAVAAHPRTLRDPTFTTAVPSGWRERHLHAKGEDAYFFSSGKTNANLLGIAPGAVGLSVGTLPASQAHHPTSAAVAMKRTVGTPTGASGVTLTKPITPAQFAGGQAATSQFTYQYQGARDVQSDIVAVHGSKVAVIEVNSPPSLQGAATQVLRDVVKAWRWASVSTKAA